MVSATIMKKQYQDIFNVNEIEKQKRNRSRHQIQHAGGLTRNEAQDLIVPSAAPIEQAVIQPCESQPSEPAPRQ
ncbi:hypothetical protein PAAG_11640 [Paracoccidioides lutzii Pb01]|uniref:Uncharacterized protein n=1 Tax=Paracoccidioides lutzii (strain ATCC MYA-826 / Pb01) TaxID=502779 RepID=A0A0A2VLC1_PARBA|nr:hypothetical protein PAAG_11640 [Paracoccidioides lutzii Pb01]KGQ01649.1 hypothetical protein PAAG_11640 [Paracoccidioides lutzii Pb01]